MQWLRRSTLLVSIGLGLSVLALVIHTFWLASQASPPLLGQRVQDLQILVIILLALSSLYTVVFLLSPSVSDRILRQQAEDTVRAVKTQLVKSVEELREVKDEFRRIMLGNEKLIRQLRSEALFWAPAKTTSLEPASPAPETHSSSDSLEFEQSSSGYGKEPEVPEAPKVPEVQAALQVPEVQVAQEAPEIPEVHDAPQAPEVDDELAKIDEALYDPRSKAEDASSLDYVSRTIGRTSDPVAAASLHYTRACLLARNGELEKASREIQMAFLNKSTELDQRLAKDTEEGGPLFELANQEPYDEVILDLLMNVSVGA